MVGATEAEPAPPWQSVRERWGRGSWSWYDSLLLAVAYALLAGVTLTVLQEPARPVASVVSLVVTVGVIRAVWLATAYGRPGSRRRDIAWCVTHTALVAVLCAVDPAFGFYAWIGFVDATAVLSRWWSLAAVSATAFLIALSEVGGIGGVAGNPLVFTVLLVVNIAIAWTLGQVIGQMQVQSEHRRQMIVELERRMRQIESLQEKLLEQAEQTGRLDERARVARELHDTVAQGLVGIITQLEAAEHDDRWAERGTTARCLARDSLVDARRSIAALSDLSLAVGLVPAVEETCRRWEALHDTPATITVDGTPHDVAFAPELLRVCQESLSNIARHASAESVAVRLRFTGDAVDLEVADDGRGFDPESVRWGFGVSGMTERARRCGGDLRLMTAPGNGCAVRVTIPVPSDAEAS